MKGNGAPCQDDSAEQPRRAAKRLLSPECESRPKVQANKRRRRWTGPSGSVNIGKEQHSAGLLQRLGVRLLDLQEVDAMTQLESKSLGCGAYGVCHKTVHPLSGEAMVIKTFRDDSLEDLTIEAENLHLLYSAGVQRLCGVCVETCQLVTHYAGITADVYFLCLRPLADEVSVLLQVARALQALHQRGYTHNDLKENNVCVAVTRGGPVATLIDLGLARPVGTWGLYSRTPSNSQHCWIAPELLEYTHPTSESSDVYSLAAMIQSALQLEERVLDYPSLTALARWVHDALCPDPGERPALAEAVSLLDALMEEAAKDQPTSASSTSCTDSSMSTSPASPTSDANPSPGTILSSSSTIWPNSSPDTPPSPSAVLLD